MHSHLGRFAQKLWLHLLRISPACGCHAFSVCDACPRWKLKAQNRYHEEGAAGLHPLPDPKVNWYSIADGQKLDLKRQWLAHPGGFAGYVNDLFAKIREYQWEQPRLLLFAGALAGLGLALQQSPPVVIGGLLAAWAYREELVAPPRRLLRLLQKAWKTASHPQLSLLPCKLRSGRYQG